MRIRRAGVLATSAFSVISSSLSSPAQADYAWLPAGSITTGRSEASATVLLDGRVLVAGGKEFSSSAPALTSCEIYDPATGTWSATGPLVKGQHSQTAVRLADGRVFVVGGTPVNGVVSRKAEIYDPASGTWTETAPAGDYHYSLGGPAAALLDDGRVIVAYGSAVGTPTAEIFNPATGQWAFTSPPPSLPWTGVTATRLASGRILFAGGYNQAPSYATSARVYDSVANTWTATGPHRVPRAYHKATLLPDGRVLLTGGLATTDADAARTEIYNPTTNVWAEGPVLPSSRAYHEVASLPDGRVLIVGGLDYPDTGFPTLITQVLVFDPTANTLLSAPDLMPGRSFLLASTLLDGSVLVAGGNSSDSFQAATLRFVQLPSASVLDGTAAEGDAGTRSLSFQMQLSAPAPLPAVISYTTQPGTATAPGDYTTTSGTLTIPVGSSQATVQVPVVGDTAPEPTETLKLGLSGATGASIADAEGIGRILDDDPTSGDFNGDGNSDVVVYRAGAWLFYDFATGNALPGVFTGQPSAGCIPAPADFDGDGQIQFSQLCGDKWYFYAADGSLAKTITTGGTGSDKPVPADYDADGKDDVAVYRQGAWFFYNYQTGALASSVFTGHPPHQTGGTSTPVPFDRDGDGKADLSIYSGGPWHFYNADGSYLKGIWTGSIAGDIPVAGDYDGDGIEDVVVWRAGAWLFYDFASGAYLPGISRYTGAPASQNGGIPLPAPIDVDGDGRLNLAVYSGGPWHFYNSDGTYDRGIWVGAVAGDQPISRRQLP